MNHESEIGTLRQVILDGFYVFKGAWKKGDWTQWSTLKRGSVFVVLRIEIEADRSIAMHSFVLLVSSGIVKTYPEHMTYYSKRVI